MSGSAESLPSIRRASTLGGLAFRTAGNHPGVMAGMVVALLILALSQGLAIVLVKGFLTVFFAGVSGAQGNESATLALSQVLSIDPRRFQSAFSWLRSDSDPVNEFFAQRISIGALHTAIPAAVLVAGLMKAGATYLYTRLQQEFSMHAGASLRDALLGTILGKPYPELAAVSPGGWMSIVINDVAFVQTRLSEFMTSFLRGGVSVAASLATMTVIHWPSALLLFFLIPLGARATGRTGRRIAGFSAAVQEAMQRMSALVLEVRARFDFMRAQHGERFDAQRFDSINQAWFVTIRRSILIRSTFAPALEFSGFALFAIFVFALDRKWIGGAAAPSDFALQFVVALGFMVKPLREIGEQLTRFHETRGAVAKCLAAISEEAAVVPLDDSVQGIDSPFSDATEVCLRRVAFTWPGGNNAAGVSFRFDDPEMLRIARGRSIAVVGPSGSGKSTLLKIMAGLAEPQQWEGTIPWKDFSAASALVPQQPYLFADTVRENVSYGRERPHESDIWSALEVMEAKDFIAGLADGLDTQVSSLAANLSGGQIQRLVIARALLRNKPVLLLDEATSALDAATEGSVLQRVVAAVRGSKRTLVAVTHRLQWLDLFDELWFVEAGRITMRGTRSELMSQPRFRDFCQVPE